MSSRSWCSLGDVQSLLQGRLCDVEVAEEKQALSENLTVNLTITCTINDRH